MAKIDIGRMTINADDISSIEKISTTEYNSDEGGYVKYYGIEISFNNGNTKNVWYGCTGSSEHNRDYYYRYILSNMD